MHFVISSIKYDKYITKDSSPIDPAEAYDTCAEYPWILGYYDLKNTSRDDAVKILSEVAKIPEVKTYISLCQFGLPLTRDLLTEYRRIFIGTGAGEIPYLFYFAIRQKIVSGLLQEGMELRIPQRMLERIAISETQSLGFFPKVPDFDQIISRESDSADRLTLNDVVQASNYAEQLLTWVEKYIVMRFPPSYISDLLENRVTPEVHMGELARYIELHISYINDNLGYGKLGEDYATLESAPYAIIFMEQLAKMSAPDFVIGHFLSMFERRQLITRADSYRFDPNPKRSETSVEQYLSGVRL